MELNIQRSFLNIRSGKTYTVVSVRQKCTSNFRLFTNNTIIFLFRVVGAENYGRWRLIKEHQQRRRDCGPCPLRSVCIGKSDFKKIDDTVDKYLYDKMHARLQTVNREKIRQLRSSTVEPVLGTLVNFLAMRRVNTRGIKQAAKCILMSAIAYNLKKLLKWEVRKIKVVAMAKMKEAENVLQNFVFTFLSALRFHPSP